MGVLSKFFPHDASNVVRPLSGYYTTLTESAPAFSSWDGSMYDHPLTRAAVERFASACSKLKPEIVGSRTCKPSVRKLAETWPNTLMTWPSFLARCATIYEMDTTVFIVPGLDRDLNTVALFPMKPAHTDILEYEGEPWCRFLLRSGEVMAIECSRVAVVSKFQYLSDFFGSGNDCMTPVLSLMDSQRQAEEQAVQNGARIRFIGRVGGMTHGEDLKKKRDQFYMDNLAPSNNTGLMLYDNTFQDVQQISEDRFVIDTDEMDRVSKQVYQYLGTNESILTNDFTEDQWGAYYEGRIEEFALKCSEALTKATYTVREVQAGNKWMFSSSRLEYASNKTKLQVIKELGGMGVLNVNQCLEIMQLPPIEGGDARIVRGEYYLIDSDNNVIAESGGHNATDPDHSTNWSSGWTDDDVGGDGVE